MVAIFKNSYVHILEKKTRDELETGNKKTSSLQQPHHREFVKL